MTDKWKQKKKWIIISIMIGIFFSSIMTFAGIDSNIQEEGVLNVEMPVIEGTEKSLFDFVLDPQELLYKTKGVRFGGGNVEKGATLLFHNKEGQYDFSSVSDHLTITNKSFEPVVVTVTVSLMDLNEIIISENKEFFEGERSFYLAIVDNQGNEQPVLAEGTASVHFEMDAMEKLGVPVSYSFGLTGTCNPNADWKGVSTRPVIKIIWCVEPKKTEANEQVSEVSMGETESEAELKSEGEEVSTVGELTTKAKSETEAEADLIVERDTTIEKIQTVTGNEIIEKP